VSACTPRPAAIAYDRPMRDALVNSLTLAGTGGHIVVAVIVILLAIAVISTLSICARYRSLAGELTRGAGADGRFRHRVLNRILHDANQALAQNGREVNSQAIIERNFQSELGALLLGERFGKSTVGLMIILGLVGTFYGLTLSIGKLVGLVSGDVSGVADITQSVTQGLAQALSGMSVAFSSSLFGIGAAIVMTLVGVFFNIADQRVSAMVKIEHYLDNVYLASQTAEAPVDFGGGVGVSTAGTGRLEQMVDRFGQSVDQLERVVAHFDAALQTLANNTRDFREFNLHLKDNIQRMSLSFGDLSEALRDKAGAVRPRDSR
jgi:hypothetical protein